MESFTMEIDKEKREEIDHVQETGVSNSHSARTFQSEADLAEHDDAVD